MLKSDQLSPWQTGKIVVVRGEVAIPRLEAYER